MADLLLLGPRFCATEVVRRLIQRHERQRQQHKVWLVTFACAELPSLKCHLFALQAPGKQQARRSTGPAGSVWEVSMLILRSWIIGSDAGPSSGTGMRWHLACCQVECDGGGRDHGRAWMGMLPLSMPLLAIAVNSASEDFHLIGGVVVKGPRPRWNTTPNIQFSPTSSGERKNGRNPETAIPSEPFPPLPARHDGHFPRPSSSKAETGG